LASEVISLDEARARVAEATGAPYAPWSPKEILWISDHWGIFSNELRQCRDLEEEIMELEIGAMPLWVLALRNLRSGARWWLREAPFPARMALATLALFAFGFAWGWL